MLRYGQDPGRWSGQALDVLLARFAPDNGEGGDAGAGSGAGAGGGTGDAGAGTGGQTGSDGQAFDAARAQALIDKLRADNKTATAAAKEAEALRAKVAEFEKAALSETERAAAELADLKAKNAALETQYQTALVQTAIEREAVKANAIDPDAVIALVDRSEITLADGAVTGADKAVAALLKAKPYLVKAEGTNGTRSVPATGKPGSATASHADLVRQEAEQLRASGRYSV